VVFDVTWPTYSCGRSDDGGRLALGCEWCLDQNNRQGWYGESFVQVLAAAAGLQCSPLTPDCTGVDLDITGTREVRDDFPCVKIQVKSWSVPRESGGAWRYGGLTEKRFNALAGPRRVPRFLFLVVVPSDVSTYAYADEEFLRLGRAAYWVSLADRARVAEPRCDRKVPVHVPRQNLLTVETLTTLCEDADLAGRRV
jgi:hypothetical protein